MMAGLHRPHLTGTSFRAVASHALLITALMVVYELIRWIDPVDFYVYMYAGQHAGTGDVYEAVVTGPRLPDGLPYNYGPAGLLLFAPLSLLPIDLAFVIWSFVQLALLAWMVHCLTHSLRQSLVWMLIFAPTTVLAQHYLWGQINLLLMAACLSVLVASGGAPSSASGSASRIQGALVGVAAAIKLTPAIFILYFIIRRNWSAFWWALGSGVIVTGLAFLCFPADSIDFFGALMNLSGRVSLGEFFVTPGNNSLQGALAFFGMPQMFRYIVLGVVAIPCFWIAVRLHRANAVLAGSLVIGLTATVLSPVSWIHHFVYILPALVLIWRERCCKWHRIAVIAVVLVLWAQGTDLGGAVIEMGASFLFPIGVLLRESLLISAAVLIVALGQIIPRGVAHPSYDGVDS